MATGSSPALFMGVDESGPVVGETSSGPVSWQGGLLLLVPVSLLIPLLRSLLRKSLHPDPRWHVRLAGKPSDYGAASLQGLSRSGWARVCLQQYPRQSWNDALAAGHLGWLKDLKSHISFPQVVFFYARDGLSVFAVIQVVIHFLKAATKQEVFIRKCSSPSGIWLVWVLTTAHSNAAV